MLRNKGRLTPGCAQTPLSGAWLEGREASFSPEIFTLSVGDCFIPYLHYFLPLTRPLALKLSQNIIEHKGEQF